MKSIFTILLLCQLPIAFGQNWLNDGAEWHYYATSEALNTYHHLTLVGDTTAQGFSWQKVKHQQYTHLPTGPNSDTLLNNGFTFQYYRMNGDTLFNFENGVEDVVIIFQDQAVWKSPNDLSDPACIRIPVYKAVAQTVTLPDATAIPSFLVSDTTISEFSSFGVYARRFGCYSGQFIAQIDCTIDVLSFVTPSFQLICYQDNNGYSIKTTNGNCDDYLTLNTEALSLNSVSVYPNPTRDLLSIATRQPIDIVECYDLKGKKMDIHFDFETNQVNVQTLNSGIYLLKILSGDDQRIVRFVIN